MPEELCQVSPKSHYGVLASHSDPSPLNSSLFELAHFSPFQVAGQGDRHDHNRSKETCFNEVLPRYHFCLDLDPPNESRYVL